MRKSDAGIERERESEREGQRESFTNKVGQILGI